MRSSQHDYIWNEEDRTGITAAERACPSARFNVSANLAPWAEFQGALASRIPKLEILLDLGLRCAVALLIRILLRSAPLLARMVQEWSIILGNIFKATFWKFGYG